MYFQRHILYTSSHVSRQQNYLKVLQAVHLPRKGAQTNGEYLHNNLDNLKIQALFQLYTIPICKAIFILKSRAGFLGTAVPKRGVGCPHFLSSLPPKAGKRTFEKPCPFQFCDMLNSNLDKQES